MTLSATILSEAEKLVQEGVWLLAVKMEIPGGPTLYRLRNTEAKTYAGHSFLPMSFNLTNWQMNLQGELPSPAMVIDKTTSDIGTHIEQYDCLQGTICTFQWINSANLGEDYSPDAVVLEIDGCRNTLADATFRLKPHGLRPKIAVPQRTCDGWICGWKFRRSEYCGYGSAELTGITIPGSGKLSVSWTGHPFVTGNKIVLEGVAGITPVGDAVPLSCYVPKNIKAVTIPESGRIEVVTRRKHYLATDDPVWLETIEGITPSLNGSWTVEVVSDYIVKLNLTDGANYSGAYVPGGTIGFDGVDSWTITYSSADAFLLDDTDYADYSGSFTAGYGGFANCERNFDACVKRGMTEDAFNGMPFGGFPFCRGDGIRLAI